MGFWARVFGGAKAATSETMAPVDGGSKPSDLQAPEQQVFAPDALPPIAAEDGAPTPASDPQADSQAPEQPASARSRRRARS